jgi:hypothetical protein
MQTLIDALACLIAMLIPIVPIFLLIKNLTRKTTTIVTWDELDDKNLTCAAAIQPDNPAIQAELDRRLGIPPIIYDGPKFLRVILLDRRQKPRGGGSNHRGAGEW